MPAWVYPPRVVKLLSKLSKCNDLERGVLC